jgi:hypothetical protein
MKEASFHPSRLSGFLFGRALAWTFEAYIMQLYASRRQIIIEVCFRIVAHQINYDRKRQTVRVSRVDEIIGLSIRESILIFSRMTEHVLFPLVPSPRARARNVQVRKVSEK